MHTKAGYYAILTIFVYSLAFFLVSDMMFQFPITTFWKDCRYKWLASLPE